MELWLWLMGICSLHSFSPSHHLYFFTLTVEFEAREEGEMSLIRNRAFLNKVINFLGVGLALYAIASAYEMFSSEPIIKHTVKCTYCRKWISVKVCLTSHLSYLRRMRLYLLM